MRARLNTNNGTSHDEIEVNADLKAPTVIRYVVPRVCAFCKHYVAESGWAYCERPHGPIFDVGDGYQLMTTCDRFKSDQGGGS